jgi:hypothetical protein
MQLEINGRGYEILRTGDLTFDEWRYCKRETGGMGVSAFEDALRSMDPDAWWALLTVSLERLRAHDALRDLGSANFAAILASLPDAEDEEAGAAEDPTPAAASEPNGHAPAADSGSTFPNPETTPAPSGHST